MKAIDGDEHKTDEINDVTTSKRHTLTHPPQFKTKTKNIRIRVSYNVQWNSELLTGEREK